MRCFMSLLPVVAAMCVLGAQAQSSSYVSGQGVDGPQFSVAGDAGAPAVLEQLTLDTQLNGGLQMSIHQGTAAAAQQTLRGQASLSVYHLSAPNLFSAWTYADFYKHVQVLPGTSGLEWGAPVQFDVVLRLNGEFGAGMLDPLAFGGLPTYQDIARSLASVDVRIDYNVVDLNQGVPGCDECGPLEVMGFGYYGHTLFDAKYGAWAGAEGKIESRWAPAGEWVGGTLPSQDNYVFTDNDIRVDDQLSHFVDTGLRRYTVSTFVGNTLEISGELSFLVQAMGQGTSSQSSAVFMQSFDAELSSGIGLAFDGETPGIYPAVPEPGSWALMLGGLALLGGRLRRVAFLATGR